ncbi:MAG: 1-deoxy-D-xylulose-5-phosphate synthase [Candidatus Omnitrophota bacterium]|nr:1-deoxy-D-xylulose-5-phosphate synthase [Candidatus Omnitrophota bacterium]
MLLENINSPQDLKKIPLEKLPILAKEIREKIVQTVSKTGGHLASSLGAVELTIALHYCFNTPQDTIIWDVGHQTYAHKILTGRNKDFDTIRQFGGISGFPSKDESVYDTFTTGHSSTAISLALGLAVGRDLAKREEKIVAVVGDGSLTGGLCFEALNNTGHLKKDIIVILNSNEMSISPSVGSLTTYLNKIISQPIYNRFREALQNFIKTRIPKVGSRMLKIASKFEEVLKGLIIPGIFFEELGFRYFGPLDGHNLELLVTTLKNISSLKEPRVLHVITKKGKGYKPAEERPVIFHSAPAFDVATGAPKKDETLGVSFTSSFSDKLIQLAKKNEKIVAITAAMPEGTGLDKFRDNFPERFFDVGIAEAHAVCFAAGLAKAGFKPIVAIYSTFLQRAYDQIIEEVSLQDLPVVFALDRAGIVGGDGVSHQGIFDISYLKNIPNLVVICPKDTDELQAMLEFAINLDKPVFIRYPKDKICASLATKSEIKLGKAEILKEGTDAAILALGTMTWPSFMAADELQKEKISCKVINMRFVKPLDAATLKDVFLKFNKILTIEEGVLEGGFGSNILDYLNNLQLKNKQIRIKTIGLPSEFIVHGERNLLLSKYGLDKTGIIKAIKELFK